MEERNASRRMISRCSASWAMVATYACGMTGVRIGWPVRIASATLLLGGDGAGRIPPQRRGQLGLLPSEYATATRRICSSSASM